MNSFIAEILGNNANLMAEESWHCAKVLRKKAGDEIRIIDGKGHFYNATLTLVSEKKSVAEIKEGPFAQQRRNYRLHLAIAPTKQIDRVEWMVEKAVEIGIDEITLMQCRNSERTSVKTDRIQKIVESAVKQSLQAFIPQVNGLTAFDRLLVQNKEKQRLIAHCFDTPKTNINAVKFKNSETLILIGPEGDFSPEEVGAARTAGFDAVSLGANRLRTETAGLYVCQAASILSQL
jgi:16S rRNA (uracil1498-N3)-methyltransferase